jgi:uncharacterized damage-inducible protein DinB
LAPPSSIGSGLERPSEQTKEERPMSSNELLVDAFERVRDAVHPAVNGLSADELTFRPDDGSNSIAWLVWHLTRIQDDHVAGLGGGEQVWTARDWDERFGLPLDPTDTGYGHDSDTVGVVVADAESLLGYYDEVHENTLAFVRGLGDDDLSRVVDRNWDPPVTVSVRLVSVIADDLQHAGQAAYVRGILLRR